MNVERELVVHLRKKKRRWSQPRKAACAFHHAIFLGVRD